MCLIFFSINKHPKYKLIVAANRDEYYSRPTQKLHWWKNTNILAGRDLEAMGTWMGVDRNGKFAALTNYRDPKAFMEEKLSRGRIVVDYFNAENEDAFYENLKKNRTEYNSYNFIGYNKNKISYYSNNLSEIKVIEKGDFAISNHLLDTSWPKVEKIKSGMAELLKSEIIDKNAVFELLTDSNIAADDKLPNTGISLEFEKLLSPIFIKSKIYGTRCSSLILIDYSNNIEFDEITYSNINNRVSFSFNSDSLD